MIEQNAQSSHQAKRRVDRQAAEELLDGIANLLHRLEQSEQYIRVQEAELATQVAISWKRESADEVAHRLEAILAAGCKSIGTQAAAIYLLDEHTSVLKMRSCIGLPAIRLSEKPRELRGSLTDLEALLGNAVIIESTSDSRNWTSPEPFPSALCIPIGTPTMPHGTLWFWGDEVRSFCSADIEVANLAADRVMCELERFLLGNEVHQARTLRRQIESAGFLQASRLPDQQPLHQDFQVAGWTFQDNEIGGAFHDWEMTPKGMMVFGVGASRATGPEGAIVASALQSALHSAWRQSSSPTLVAQHANDVLWGAIEADWSASLASIQINPVTEYGSICTAGKVQAFIVSHRGFRPVGQANPFVAKQPDPQFSQQRFVLQPGEVLVACQDQLFQTQDVGKSHSRRKSTMQQCDMLNLVRSMLDESANDIAHRIACLLPSRDIDSLDGPDRSLLVIRNVRKP